MSQRFPDISPMAVTTDEDQIAVDLSGALVWLGADAHDLEGDRVRKGHVIVEIVLHQSAVVDFSNLSNACLISAVVSIESSEDKNW